MRHGDDLGDEDVMKAVIAHRMGVPEDSPMFRNDSWLFSAVAIIRSYDERCQLDEARRESTRG